jgi:hypothetical protein
MVEVLLACLPDDEHAKLRIANPERRPMFDYAIFVHHLDLNDLCNTAPRWYTDKIHR